MIYHKSTFYYLVAQRNRSLSNFIMLNDLCCVGNSLNVVFSIFGSAEQLSIVNIYVPSRFTLLGL